MCVNSAAGYPSAVRAPTPPDIAATASSAVGAVLAGASRTLTWTRGSRKPLHPVGDVVTGRLVRSGGHQSSGVPWLDQPGTDEVLVRFSRAIGLPHPLPDIFGIAIRVPDGDRPADLLLATTGLGRLTRLLLTPATHPRARPFTTLLPYRGPQGPIFIAARPLADLDGKDSESPAYELLWSSGLGGWVGFARLEVAGTSGPDPTISFDPVRNPLPGLGFYGWVRRLREPAYRAARDASGR